LNYVERHFGDWAKDTAHLSMLEDGAYNRLCDLYYVRETPLPADLAACCRLVRATSKQERAAVASVLQEFFVLTPAGWAHKRCDEEIERFRAGEPEREVKKANEDNRMRRHREERARLFKTLTDAGQHAAWNIPMNDLRELVQRLDATPPATGTVTQPATAPATPATATHYPLPTTHKQPTVVGRGSRLPTDWTPGEPGFAFAQQQGLANGKAQAELEKFRDWWAAQPGQKGVKLDWQATWRTWVRKATEMQRGKPGEDLGAMFRRGDS
jgi:uncharacterized protein YdaU (DUF1376 family)